MEKEKVKVGGRYKKQIAPNIWEYFEVVGKTEKGSFRTREDDGSYYIEPFLEEAIPAHN